MNDPTPIDETAHDPATDAELLRRSRRSSAAFRMLYDRHSTRIHAFLLRRTRDPVAAFEATAETFAQAWISREKFTDPGDGNASPWLFGIARNVLANSVRRRALEHAARDRLGLAVGSAEPAVDDTWLDGMDGDLADALNDLPEGQRRAIELRVLEDRGYDDVARTLATTPAAARVRVHRGLAEMRRRLTASSDG